MPNLYEDLGVDPDADTDAIKRAHRRKARQHHPDTGDGDSEAFHRASRAWLVLQDPAKRAKYDRDGDTGEEPDNRASMLASMMNQALEKALSAARGDFEHVDLVDLMIQDSRQQHRHLEGEIKKGQDALKRVDKMLRRIRFKGSGTNMLEAILKDKQGNLRDQIRALEQSRDGFERLIAVLGDYGWEVDRGWEAEDDPVLALAGSGFRDRYRRATDGI